LKYYISSKQADSLKTFQSFYITLVRKIVHKKLAAPPPEAKPSRDRVGIDRDTKPFSTRFQLGQEERPMDQEEIYCLCCEM
jgi:hypothetical protein